MSNYLIHIPHSSTVIPKEYMDDYYLTQEELQANVLEYSDNFADIQQRLAKIAVILQGESI